MKKFKKNPEFVNAEQWLGMEEQSERLLSEGVIMESSARDGSVLVPTLGGNLTCRLNDYIVTDKDEKRSVVDCETFESSYELTDEVEEVTNEDVAEIEAENILAEEHEVVVEEVVVAPEVEAKPKGKK